MSNNPYEAPQHIGNEQQSTDKLDYASYPKIAELRALDSIKEKTAPDKLLALVDEGFLYLSRQIPHWGSYENVADLLPWENIDEVIIKNHFSILGFLGGCVALLMGIGVFIAGWIEQTLNDPIIYFLPIGGPIVFYVCTFGIRRNKMIVRTGKSNYKWISGPLEYKTTSLYCAYTTWLCEKHSIPCRSHVAGVEPVSAKPQRPQWVS